MRNVRIVADSSANRMELKGNPFDVVVKIGRNLGLCSYYAEKGGLLVGFEEC